MREVLLELDERGECGCRGVVGLQRIPDLLRGHCSGVDEVHDGLVDGGEENQSCRVIYLFPFLLFFRRCWFGDGSIHDTESLGDPEVVCDDDGPPFPVGGARQFIDGVELERGSFLSGGESRCVSGDRHGDGTSCL